MRYFGVESILATRRQHNDGSTGGIVVTMKTTAHDLFKIFQQLSNDDNKKLLVDVLA